MSAEVKGSVVLDKESLPILVVRKNGKTIAVVRDNSLEGAFLPFYLPACEVMHLRGDEELKRAREGGVLNVSTIDWPIVVKLRVVLGCVKEENLWVLVSCRGVNSGELIGRMFPQSEEGAAAATGWLGTLPLNGLCEVLLANEPIVHDTSPNEDVGRIRLKKEDEGVNERVVFVDSVVDVAHYIDVFLRSHISRGATAPTAVFWPPELAHPVNIHYAETNQRVLEHGTLLLPMRPLLRMERRVKHWDAVKGPKAAAARCVPRTGRQWERHLMRNVHMSLREYAPIPGGEVCVTTGSYDYYHYLVDGFKDSGWGCAYRSLQTILSWFQYEGLMEEPIPSILTIQEILSLKDADKTNRKGFVGSKDWIGSFEIMIVLQHYISGLECTIKRMESGAELDTNAEVQMLLADHFRGKRACPVMIGGSSYAHTILGVDLNLDTMEARYLIADPHYASNETSVKVVLNKGYIGWKEASRFFEAKSWYNLCIPQVSIFDPR